MTAVRVLLTDDDNGCLLVECPDQASAQDLASAAVFSDGGVSAWLVPDAAVPHWREVADQLREGFGLSDVLTHGG